jgi:protease-4
VIYVQGEMTTTSSERICSDIREASEDSFVKALVLRINSPGGTPAAAQEIIAELKKVSKPIVVSMGDIAASGAYYISIPADFIIANPDTMTGSIGVSLVFENREEYFHEEGIDYTVIKSGELKDMGAPWRNLTEEEQEYAREVVMDCYNRFVEEVAEGRNMSIEEVKTLSDGRIYSGSTAKELGLIDKLGNLYDAIDLAAELANLAEVKVKYFSKPNLFKFIFSESPYGEILW